MITFPYQYSLISVLNIINLRFMQTDILKVVCGRICDQCLVLNVLTTERSIFLLPTAVLQETRNKYRKTIFQITLYTKSWLN